MPTYKQTAGGSPGLTTQNSGTCQLCGATNCSPIFDAILQSRGNCTWGWVCESWFAASQGELGVGFGQRYDRCD